MSAVAAVGDECEKNSSETRVELPDRYIVGGRVNDERIKEKWGNRDGEEEES